MIPDPPPIPSKPFFVPAPPAPRAGAPKPPARIAVVSTLYHQLPGEQPTAWVSRYDRNLTRPNQAYDRRLEVGERWTKLDTGWLAPAEVGTVLLLNRSPAPKGKGEEPAVVEVGVAPPEPPAEKDRDMFSAPRPGPPEIVTAFLLPPGHDLRALPVDVGRLRLRCPSGKAAVQMVLVPA